MSSIKEIIMKIVELPESLYRMKSTTFYELLFETGYVENHKGIFEDDIAKILIEDPKSMNKWLEWSENKRTMDGWFFTLISENKYEVGRVDQDGSKDEQMIFHSKRNACAAFIKREIEEARNTLSR